MGPLATPKKGREVGSVDPWTPTSNLKMLISAASPDIRNREKELCMDSDRGGGLESIQVRKILTLTHNRHLISQALQKNILLIVPPPSLPPGDWKWRRVRENGQQKREEPGFALSQVSRSLPRLSKPIPLQRHLPWWCGHWAQYVYCVNSLFFLYCSASYRLIETSIVIFLDIKKIFLNSGTCFLISLPVFI